MNNFEFNKLFAAFLIAGITAYLGWFVSEKAVHPHKLHKNAVEIDGGEVAGGGPAKASGPDPILALLTEADVAKGQKLSKACAACHSFDKGGANKVGPNLWGTVGGKIASKAGFSYSGALTEIGGNWGYDELNHFLWKPKKFASGTKMNYAGLKKPEQRAALIAWLRTMSDSPAPLPSAGDIAAEAEKLAPPETAPETTEKANEEAAPETPEAAH